MENSSDIWFLVSFVFIIYPCIYGAADFWPHCSRTSTAGSVYWRITRKRQHQPSHGQIYQYECSSFGSTATKLTLLLCSYIVFVFFTYIMQSAESGLFKSLREKLLKSSHRTRCDTYQQCADIVKSKKVVYIGVIIFKIFIFSYLQTLYIYDYDIFTWNCDLNIV